MFFFAASVLAAVSVGLAMSGCSVGPQKVLVSFDRGVVPVTLKLPRLCFQIVNQGGMTASTGVGTLVPCKILPNGTVKTED